jgi:iron(III) transport system substrate-binding protein
MNKLFSAFIALFFFACTGQAPKVEGQDQTEDTKTEKSGEVNVYTHRHYKADQLLFDRFTKATGIEVNVLKASADELMVRMEQEGVNCPADLLVTVDAGRLVRAQKKGLLQAIRSVELEANIPEHLKDEEGYWFGQTIRARLLVYSKERVNPAELSTYAALTDPKWKGKLLVRSSENIYNRSLLASMIANEGAENAQQWAAGIVANMGRHPKGNDRDQVKAIVAGIGDVAIVNSYYIGKLLTSEDIEEVKVGQAVGVFFPDQEVRGTHINISGAGVAAYAPNKENAILLLEFMAGEEAQQLFAEANHEYPVRPGISASELLLSWGNFKSDELDMRALGYYNEEAARIFDVVGWK